MSFLAYTPFIDPLDLHGVWFLLLIPLGVLTAASYKSVRVPDMRVFWRQTLFFSLQIIGAIAGLYVASWVFLDFILPVIV